MAGPPGVLCEWTIDLAPVGERRVVAGQLVELHVRLDAAAAAVNADASVAFDILAADVGGEPEPTPLLRLLAGGATAPDGVATAARHVSFQDLADGQDVASARTRFVAEHSGDPDAHLLMVVGPAGADLITWWRVAPGAARALHFAIEIDGLAGRPRTPEALQTDPAPAGARTLTFELRSEDDAPMAEARLEAAFEGGQRARAATGPDGRATIEFPPGASEVFRLFLLSYVETAPGIPPPRPDEPGRPVLPQMLDTRPEVVSAFAFDSAFPGPAVHAALARVREKAGVERQAKLIVFGHTDPVGTDAYNLGLSGRRAQAVLALLLDDREMFEAVATTEGWDTLVHQSMLRGVGCNPGAIDGDAGALTRTATANFQREHNAGVYHRRAVVERDRPVLAIDGDLGPATRAALRDAYVAVAPHVRRDRFADPPFEGCGEKHLISGSNDENRRAVVALLPADADLSQSSACERYADLVGETPDDLRTPRFSDHQWLLEETGALHLSAATIMPDGTPARVRVVRCDRRPPLPPPDSSGGGPPPRLGQTLIELPAQIAGGVCAARWSSPDPQVLDSETWVVDHDVPLEILDPADHEAPAPGDPASGAALLAADALLPPVFVLEAGESWSVSPPPSTRLERVRVGPPNDEDELVEDGLGIRPDGSLVRFTADNGLADPERPADVVSIVVADHRLAGSEVA